MAAKTHADRLATIDESVRGVTARIVSTWERATDSDKESGATWYAEGEGIVDRLAVQTRLSREHMAAVISHLSPRTTWARNVAGATSLVLNGDAPGCIGANIERARRALDSTAPLETLRGPKTRRFASNLLGDRESVTVDVWAARIAFGEHDDYELRLRKPGVYDAIEHCYQLAARRIGVQPATMQATTWIVARNGRSQ